MAAGAKTGKGEKMKPEEMIDKYGIKLTDDGEHITSSKRITPAVIEAVKAVKPEIIAILKEKKAKEVAEAAEFWKRYEARRAAERLADQPLLDKMHEEVAEMVAKIPADYVRVTVTQTGDLDGSPILEYEAEGVTLRWDQVEVVGTACAIRPNCMGAFAEERVCMISRAKLYEIAKEIAKKEEAQKEAERELTETVIPTYAREAYRKYNGDADKAWENEDETSWALISRWAPYIEAQS